MPSSPGTRDASARSVPLRRRLFVLAAAAIVPLAVMREGQLRYVLSAVVKPDAIFDVVRRQQLPADWVVSVFDAKTQRVARSREHEAYLGQPPSPSLAALMKGKGDEGAGVTYSM